MNIQTACIIGSSGLIGSNILKELLQNASIQKIRVLVRKPLEIKDEKLEQIVVNFTDLSQLKKALEGSQVVFCAIGTTRKKTKNLDEYRKIDVDIPLNTAKICKELGGTHFILVSSVGANAQSNNFYLRLKGETEMQINALHLSRFSVFRPSMLLGSRQEFRFGEKIGQILMRFFSFLIPSNYKPIEARLVALSMISVALNPTGGSNVYHYREMIQALK